MMLSMVSRVVVAITRPNSLQKMGADGSKMVKCKSKAHDLMKYREDFRIFGKNSSFFTTFGQNSLIIHDFFPKLINYS